MKSIQLALVLLLNILCVSPTLALSTDRDQPAEIEADDIEFDFKKGTRTYIKNVLVVQGTLRIKADKLHTIYTNGDLDTATAWGSLARFKQRPDGKPDDVEGWAKKIIVDQKNNLLTLIGKAAIKQGSDTARGETIIYDMANDTLKVKGGAKVGASGQSGATPPKRTIEDPFKDDNQGPSEAAIIQPKQAETSDDDAAQSNSKESSTNTEKENAEPKKEIYVAPVRSGRSRLIIQPR